MMVFAAVSGLLEGPELGSGFGRKGGSGDGEIKAPPASGVHVVGLIEKFRLAWEKAGQPFLEIFQLKQ
jgi:hypothetical protein